MKSFSYPFSGPSFRSFEFPGSLRFLGSLGLIAATFLCSCAPRPATGPDQTVVGSGIGAGIGSGAGMVIGNQIGHLGSGAAVGAGFGLLAGAATGFGLDRIEETQVETKQELDAVRAQTAFNRLQLDSIQRDFDVSAKLDLPVQSYQVYFDDNATSLRSGAIAELEHIADNLKTSRSAVAIEISGHADESGSPEYNMQLSEARARNVAAYLQARGISVDQVSVKSFGSTRPIGTNATPVGRQLNRRVEVRVTQN